MQLRTVVMLSSLAVVLGGCDPGRERPDDPIRTHPVESIRVAGILVDTWCYSNSGESGGERWPPPVDTACSNQSVKLGYPVAVVVDTDSVWVLSENPRVFAKFLNDSVRVSGDIRSEGVLIPRTFDRKSADGWQTIL